MKRLIVVVVMLVVGMMLVGSAEAFCVYNNTDDDLRVDVTMKHYIGTINTKQTTYYFFADPKARSCEDKSVGLRIIDIKVTFAYSKSSMPLCSFTLDSPKDFEITKVNKQIFCSQKN